MRIQVKQEHIDKGTRGNPFHCAIAQAIKSQFEGLKFLDICVEAGRISVEGKSYRSTVAVKKFIDRFDESLIVSPFSFNLISLKS